MAHAEPGDALVTVNRSFHQAENIRQLLRGSMAAPLVVAGCMMALLLWQISQQFSATASIAHTDVVIAQSGILRRHLVDTDIDVHDFVVTGREESLRNIAEMRPQLHTLFATLRTAVADDAQQVARLDDIERLYAAWQGREDQTIARRRRGETDDDARNTEARAEMDRLRERFRAFAAVEQDRRADRVRRSQDAARRTLVATVALTLVLGSFLAWFARRHMVRLAGIYDTSMNEIEAQARELRENEVERARLLEDERRARAAAEQNNRLKDEFLATVSHELRTPLTAILGWARLLRGDSGDAARRARAVETIERNAHAQAQLIEDLLDVSRIITGKMRIDVHAVDPAAVVNGALEALRPAADAKAIRIQASLDPGAGPVMGDPERLQQIAWNVLSNAIKFTPRGGRVTVRLSREGTYAELVVEDTGQGIAPEFLRFVFDRFRQEESTSTRTHQGLGLGLAIVRHLVELHGGTVEAHSDGEGKGARFVVRIPALQVPSMVESGASIQPLRGVSTGIEPLPPRLDGLRVLVVDDQADARDLIASVLGECGAAVSVSATVRDALIKVRAEHPDVLVSDIGLPGEDGYDLVRQMRAFSPDDGGRTPAIALTAYARVEDRTNALRAGFSIHLPKPIEPNELAIVVAHVAGRLGSA